MFATPQLRVMRLNMPTSQRETPTDCEEFENHVFPRCSNLYQLSATAPLDTVTRWQPRSPGFCTSIATYLPNLRNLSIRNAIVKCIPILLGLPHLEILLLEAMIELSTSNAWKDSKWPSAVPNMKHFSLEPSSNRNKPELDFIIEMFPNLVSLQLYMDIGPERRKTITESMDNLPDLKYYRIGHMHIQKDGERTHLPAFITHGQLY